MATRRRRRKGRPARGTLTLASPIDKADYEELSHLEPDLDTFVEVASALIPQMILERTAAGEDMFGRPLRTDLRDTGAMLAGIRVVRADIEPQSGPMQPGATRSGVAVIEVSSTGSQPDTGFPNARLAAIIHKGRRKAQYATDESGQRRLQRPKRGKSVDGPRVKGQPFLGLSRKQRNELLRRLLAAGLLRVVEGPADS